MDVKRLTIFDPTVVMYLTPVPWAERFKKEWGDLLKVKDERFQHFVQQSVLDFVAGEVIPEAIKTAVCNVADDVMAGREPVLRAGDYIALMGYAKEKVFRK